MGSEELLRKFGKPKSDNRFFGGGLTYCSLLVKWGTRVTPLGTSDAALPPCTETALAMVNRVRANQDPHGRSHAGLMAPVFAEARVAART